MKFISKIAVASIVVGGMLTSCGGASNNDQGVSVTFLGYRAMCDGTEPDIGGVTEPFSARSESTGVQTAGGIIAGLIVQNNLSSQHVITQNAFFEYYVPGATAQPPATSSAAGAVIGHGAGDDGSEASRACIATFVVPAEVRTWMLLNRTSLPEPPFTMEVRGYVTMLTSAGDRLDTNELNFIVQFTPDIVIPDDGSSDTGIGGDDAGAVTGDVDAITSDEGDDASGLGDLFPDDDSGQIADDSVEGSDGTSTGEEL